MPVYELSENNSGGSWWLNKAQYEALFEAGWYYEPWPEERGSLFGNPDEPFLGGDVPYGWRHRTRIKAESLQAAVESFEAATGEDFFAQGCNCCGVPFSIGSVDEDGGMGPEYISGNDARLETVRPF